MINNIWRNKRKIQPNCFLFFGFLYRSRGSKGPPGRVRSRFRRWKTGVLQLQTCGAHGLRSAEAPGRVRSRFRRWKTDVLQLQTCGDMSKLYLPDTLMPWQLLRAWVSKDRTRLSPPKAGPAMGKPCGSIEKIDIDHLHVTITSFVVVCKLSFSE